MSTSKLQYIYKEITRNLNEILSIDKNIKGAIISNLSGMLIAYAIKDDYQAEISLISGLIEGLAATLSAIYGAASVAGEDIKLAKTQLILVEYENGNLIICDMGHENILAIIADKRGALGAIRIIAKKYGERIKPLLIELDKIIEDELSTNNARESVKKELSRM
ncbi:MAG: roadblock/LC7 domain-containing protein [Candidatus Njordarchaeales archaeon]